MPTDTLIRQYLADLLGAALRTRTQKEFALSAGISQQTLSAIITGERADLRADAVARIARELGLSPTALGRLMYDCHPPKKLPKKSRIVVDKISDRGNIPT